MLTTSAIDYYRELFTLTSFVTVDPNGENVPGIILETDVETETCFVERLYKNGTKRTGWFHWSSLQARKPDLRDCIRKALQQQGII